MELRTLRVFVLSAKYLNFSKVADALFLSQSSVSKYISALEAELGEKLMVRDSKSVKLTRFGESFLPYAERLLAQEEQMQDFLHHYKAGSVMCNMTVGVASSLTVSPPNLLLFRMIRSISCFHDQYPDIHIKLQYYHDNELRALVRDGQVDLAVLGVGCGGSDSDESLFPGLCSVQLEVAENFLIYSPQLGKFDRLTELVPKIDTLIYSHDPVPQRVSLEFVQRFRISPAITPCQNWSELFIKILDGVGAGLVPKGILSLADSCNIPHFSLEDYGISSSIFAIYRPQAQGTPLEQLVSILLEEFSKEQPA